MEQNHQKIFIIIPVYNEEAVIESVIKEIQEAGYNNIIIVDDGSSDETYQKVKENDTYILQHRLNRGKGAATKTGIEAAKILDADIIVTMDGDGQHDPKDIKKLIRPLQEKNCDVVLGSRMQNTGCMPWYKICANHIGNIITWYLFGLWVSDSQSGFRAYNKKAFNIINTRYDRYEYDSEVIHEINAYKLSYKEVPITVRYTEYSMNKVQKQGFINGLKTVYKMILKILT